MNLKEIEKRFDEHFHHGPLNEHVKKFYRDEIRDILEGLKMEEKNVCRCKNCKNAGWNKAVQEINNHIDNILNNQDK